MNEREDTNEQRNHGSNRPDTSGDPLDNRRARDPASAARPPGRQFLDRIREAADYVATRSVTIAELTHLPATRILDDIHIEATELLMRWRWEPENWGPQEPAQKCAGADPTTPKNKGEGPTP